MHWGPFHFLNKFAKTVGSLKLPRGISFSDEFHVFGLIWNERGIRTYIDDVNDPRKTILEVNFNETFWEKGDFGDQIHNPWENGAVGAPFDKEFYIVMNLAVGGTTGYWPDGYGKPWRNDDAHSVNSFYSARNAWEPTWKGDDAALQVDYVHVWQD